MEIVRHRVNTVSELASLDPAWGAEIDIRSRGGRLILHHDAHADGPRLEDFLDAYARTRRERLLILNPKEDGHDELVLRLCLERRIGNFFFLDLTFPSIVRVAVRGGEPRVAVRVSEYEPAAAAKAVARWVDWVWLDCFSGKPAPAAALEALKKDFKVCLVSPELEGYPPETIARFKSLARTADAVCTKHPERWL